MAVTAGFGELCSLLSALAWAIGLIAYRQLGTTLPPLQLNFLKNLLRAGHAAAGHSAAARLGDSKLHGLADHRRRRQRRARHRHRRHPVFPRAQRARRRSHGRARQFLQPVRDRAQLPFPRRAPAAGAIRRLRPGQPGRLGRGLAAQGRGGPSRSCGSRLRLRDAGNRADGGLDHPGQAGARSPAPALGHRRAHARRAGGHGGDRLDARRNRLSGATDGRHAVAQTGLRFLHRPVPGDDPVAGRLQVHPGLGGRDPQRNGLDLHSPAGCHLAQGTADPPGPARAWG